MVILYPHSSNWIAHICSKHSWQTALRLGVYHNETLESEGFIHCSKPEQVLFVANRFFQNTSGLVILWINPQKLIAPLQWDQADNQIFPHLYGEINLDAVESVWDFRPDADGIFRNLPGL